MDGMRALDLALELARMPTLAAGMRLQPLPSDAIDLMKVAGGNDDALREAARRTGRRPEAIRSAAILYLQQILLAPESDCYRTLGVAPGATKVVMREHMRWLMQWLHPDHSPGEWDSVFAARVLAAWREANTTQPPIAGLDAPGERSAPRPGPQRGLRKLRPTQRWVALPLPAATDLRRRRNRRMAMALIAGVIAIGVLLLPVSPLLPRWLSWLGFGDEGLMLKTTIADSDTR